MSQELKNKLLKIIYHIPQCMYIRPMIFVFDVWCYLFMTKQLYCDSPPCGIPSMSNAGMPCS